MPLPQEKRRSNQLGEWARKYIFLTDSTYTVNKRIFNRRTRRDIRLHDRMLTKSLQNVNFDF